MPTYGGVPQAGRIRERGFTLIEVLVVMIVIGVLAAIAIPILLNVRNRAYDTDATAVLRNGLTAEINYGLENPAEGYMDLWQNSAARAAAIAQIEGRAVWYDGWAGDSPAPGQVMVRAGHVNSGTWVDDWLILTVLSKSGDCMSVSREDTAPQVSPGLVIGTYYWRAAAVNGHCPQTPNGNLPPSIGPTGRATSTAWGASW